MIYKGYMVFPFRNYFKITDMDGKFIANVDSYEEAREEIELLKIGE